MEHRVAAIAVAGAIAGVLSVGAISLASAQSTTTPPTTPSTTTTQPTHDDDRHCPNRGGTPGSDRTTTDQTYGDPT